MDIFFDQPIEYLQYKELCNKTVYQDNYFKMIYPKFVIDGENVYKSERDEFNKEEFREHPIKNLKVSNYGRIKYNGVIIPAEEYKTGWYVVQIPFFVHDLVSETNAQDINFNRPHTQVVGDQIKQTGYEMDYEIIDNPQSYGISQCPRFEKHPIIDILVSEAGHIVHEWTRERFKYELFSNYARIYIPFNNFRLTAETWYPDHLSCKNSVDHIVKNGQDNTIYNLQWLHWRENERKSEKYYYEL
jgi:hypothetical protein